MTWQTWQPWVGIALAIFAMTQGRALGGGDEVVVLYVKNSPESKSVAEYYASRRGVPSQQLIGLNVTAGDNLTREDFERLVELPLIQELQNRQLCRFETSTVPASGDFPARTRYRCVESKVRYLAPTWGFPYHIANAPGYREKGMESVFAGLQINEACLDSDLALIAAKGYFHLFGTLQNFAYAATNGAIIHPTNGLFCVTRLDGPTVEDARGLVDKAMAAETNGLWGNAYFDERGLKDGPYLLGDQWITNAARVARAVGFPTFVDHQPDTFPGTFPLSQVALYAGWYEVSPSGPFANGTVEFAPGAIAYHLHSFSAANLRSTVHYWVGPLIHLGATATMGCVAEPYLHLTPEPHVLLERMIFAQFTFGEASIACQSQLSWMNVFIGDPLYRPFGRSLDALEKELHARKDSREEWAILRKINLYLLADKPRGLLLHDLQDLPLLTNSAVLSEKMAMLQAESIEFRAAIEAGQRALRLATSPAQKLRLGLNIAEWQALSDQPEGAYQTLRQVEESRPDYRESVPFRQKQLNLARDARLTPEIDRLTAELNRLRPPSPATPGTKN